MLAGLVLLVFVAAAPAFAVLLNLQRELQQEREHQAHTIALQQAELLDAGVAGVVEGVRQVMLAIAASPLVQGLDPACRGVVDDIRTHMPRFAMIAVLAPDRHVVCDSTDASITPLVMAGLVAGLHDGKRFTVGGYTAVPGAKPVLPFALALPGNGQPGGMVVLALDLAPLDGALNRRKQPLDGVSVVTDAAGIVLAAHPPTAAEPGGLPDPEFRRATGGTGATALTVLDRDDRERVIGWVPAGAAASGLFVAASFNLDDISGGIDRATSRGYLLITFGVAISFLLALLVGQRYLRAPAAVLLAAARRWGAGDLSARAVMPASAGSEFADLGSAFNTMAETLAGQRGELQRMNEALEVRVAERTRALLESNNRLQVEIAERELTESSLRQAQKLQVVGQLAGGIAHDFNNLLTAILGSLELLRATPDTTAPRAARLFDNATEAVNRGTRLTSQLLAFSRKQPLLAVSVDIAAAVGGMQGLLASTLGASNRLDVRIDPDLWPCMLDPNQFEAALLNLALNARDAMHRAGRVTIAAGNVVITAGDVRPDLPPGEYVRIMVADSGVGMSTEVMSRAFEPFFTTKEAGKSSGLGLSQVHGMVRQSGGAVFIESRPGAGTRVIMMLPRSLTPALAPEAAGDPCRPALQQDRVILLVDDDTNVREVTEATLVESGYSVLTAPDGPSALDVLDQAGSAVAIVIADYAMPGMTGRELLEIVRRRRPDVAVMLATGYADYTELIGEGLSMEQIIRKPFRSRDLLARIHAVYGGKLAAEVAVLPGE